MVEPAQQKILDARGLRALAHPVRMRLLRELGLGEAKVSDLAAAVHEPANSVSFHLRQLEKYGFVRRSDGPEGTSRKESWWATAQQELSLGTDSFRDGEEEDEGAAAREALMATLRINAVERTERMCASLRAYRDPDHPRPDLTGVTSEWRLLLSPDERRELAAELEALYAKWGARSQPAAPDSVRYTLAIDLFPEPPGEAGPAPSAAAGSDPEPAGE